MPTVIISTLCEDGTTNLGPYSLVQPYYVAGKDYYAMLLCCRNSSNTAQNILRNGKSTLNFIDDNPKTFKEVVKLSWPGELNGYPPPYHDFNGTTSKFGAHLMLKIDKILMKKKYSDAIINGVRAKENGVELITAEHMQIINDKRAKEKNKK